MSESTLNVYYMIIDCDTCEVRDKACGDCVVSFLTIPVRAAAQNPGVRPILDDYLPHDVPKHIPMDIPMDKDQQAAVNALVEGGLVPPLRLVHSAPQGSAPSLSRRAGTRAS